MGQNWYQRSGYTELFIARHIRSYIHNHISWTYMYMYNNYKLSKHHSRLQRLDLTAGLNNNWCVLNAICRNVVAITKLYTS